MAELPVIQLREAVNVPDELARDALVSRMAKMRAEAVSMRNSTLAWNAANPHRVPFDTDFEDCMIAWCDGVASLKIPPLPRDDPRDDTKD